MSFSGSYAPEDVEFLLEPEFLAQVSVAEKEAAIARGQHYSELLSVEKPPTEAYLSSYRDALLRNGGRFARDLAILARGLVETYGDRITLVSLARAGTPVGVALRRLLLRHGVSDVVHYSISIIRDRGLDFSALRHIVENRPPESVCFLDGWTGKGVIRRELRQTLSEWRGPTVPPALWVVADLSGTSDQCATREDYLIPSSILGGTISGLISRSVWSPVGLHRCRPLPELAEFDLSREFIDTLESLAPLLSEVPSPLPYNAAAEAEGDRLLANLLQKYQAEPPHVKPGIGESTRVMLRRQPRRLILKNERDPDVAHLLVLAGERQTPVEIEPDLPYRAAALIEVQED